MRVKNLKYILILGVFSFLAFSHNIIVFGHGAGA
ncbi:hypothetical protein KAI37_04704 [Paenibacillus sp. S25]|nr:hypothetical protein KAI37_04704 [Paenibacillus sp. S25]